MGKGDEHFVVGNGVIKSKPEIKAGSPKGSNGGAPAPTAVSPSLTNKGKKKGHKTVEMSDNGDHEVKTATCSDQNNNNNRGDPNATEAHDEESSDDDSVTPTDYEDAQTTSGSESDNEAEVPEPEPVQPKKT